MNASKFILALSVWFLGACNQAPPNPDSSVYLGSAARTHYSELTQITPSNVGLLEAAWVFDTDEFAPGVSTMVTSPLVIDGVLYGLTPLLNAFALDATNGEELWRYTLDEPADVQHGMMWWSQDASAEVSSAESSAESSRLFYTAGPYLIALDPYSGKAIDQFGESGKLDLRQFEDGRELRAPSPGVIFEDLIIVGVESPDSSGSVMAISAQSGLLVWQFSTGSDTQLGASASVAPTLDSQRGIVFISTGPSEPQLYGVDRPDDNPLASSLVALDARTGELRWYFQVTRHDLWGRELASPVTLVQAVQADAVIDAVALATRSGHLYLFERETGALLSPTKEVAGIPSELPGERTAETQTVSMITFTRQAFSVSQRDPVHVASLVKSMDSRPFAPPSLDGIVVFPGDNSGAGWGGAAYDPERRKLILNTQETASVLRLLNVPAGFSDRDEYLKNCAKCHGADRKGTFADRQDRYGAGGPNLVGVGQRLSSNEIEQSIRNGRGSMPAFPNLSEFTRRAIARYLISNPSDLTQENRTRQTTYVAAKPSTIRDTDKLPGNQPPWGSLVALDLDSGTIDWQVPLGNYPSHPTLGLGAENAGGPLLTASGLLFIAATPDMKIGAYSAVDGRLLWQSDLDAAGYSTPVSYSVDDQQYVVIAAGGGLLGPPSGSTYAAFRLPISELAN